MKTKLLKQLNKRAEIIRLEGNKQTPYVLVLDGVISTTTIECIAIRARAEYVLNILKFQYRLNKKGQMK